MYRIVLHYLKNLPSRIQLKANRDKHFHWFVDTLVFRSVVKSGHSSPSIQDNRNLPFQHFQTWLSDSNLLQKIDWKIRIVLKIAIIIDAYSNHLSILCYLPQADFTKDIITNRVANDKKRQWLNMLVNQIILLRLLKINRIEIWK